MIATILREILPGIVFATIMALANAAGHPLGWWQIAALLLTLAVLFGVHNFIVRSSS